MYTPDQVELQDRFKSLFEGRLGVRLRMWPTGETREDGKQKWEGRTEYETVDWAAHLAGSMSNGTCIVLENGATRHGCIDLDEYRNGRVVSAKAVKAIHDRLEKVGVKACLTRSKSGGIHVWLSCEEPYNAAHMRLAVVQAFRVFDPNRNLKADIFPWDNETIGKNQINLPFFGNTRLGIIVDGDEVREDVPLEEWLDYAEGRINSIDVFKALDARRFTTNPDRRRTRAREPEPVPVGELTGREPADPQGRNDFLFSYGRSLRARGADDAQVEEMVLAKDLKMWKQQHPLWVRGGCPYQQDKPRQLAATIRSICKKPPGQHEARTDQLDLIEDLNDDYAYITIGEKPAILNKREWARDRMNGQWLMTPEAFRLEHGTTYVTMGGKTKSLAQAWLGHPTRSTYSGITFDPDYDFDPEREKNPKLNTWRGFAREPIAGDVSPWHDLLAKVCNGIELLMRQIDHAFANLVQRPMSKKPCLAFMNHGYPGCGKTTVPLSLVTAIGHALYFEAKKKEDITGDFNDHLIGKILIMLEEAIFTKDQKTINFLKTMISALYCNYQPKFKGRLALPNIHLIYATTNDKHALSITHDDRRWTVWGTKYKWPGKAERRAYFNGYYAWLNGDGASALMHHWLTLEVDHDLISEPLETEDRADQVERSLGLTEEFLVECAREGRLPQDTCGEGKAPVRAIRDRLLEMARGRRVEVPGQPGREIREYIEVKEARVTYTSSFERDADGLPKRIPGMQGLEFPSLIETREALTRSLGVTDWPNDVHGWLNADGDASQMPASEFEQLANKQLALEAEIDDIRRKLGRAAPF